MTVTGLGAVTVTVNGAAVEIPQSGILTVTRYDDVVFTASPDPNQYLTGWTLDSNDYGNGSMTLTLTDVTQDHTVAADFAASQLVNFQTVCGENGSLTAKAGYGETLSPINAATGISVEKGKKVVVTAAPDTGYMVKAWTINGTTVTQENMEKLGVTMEHYLSNQLVIETLDKAIRVEVSFESYRGFAIPKDGTDYTLEAVTRNPGDTEPEDEIRRGGDLSFTVKPVVPCATVGTLVVNGYDCVLEEGTPVGCSSVAARENQDGSITVTILDVADEIQFEIQINDCPSKKYTDLDTTEWYHEDTDYVISNGLMRGTGDTTFEPDTVMDRAMMVTLLYRMEQEPEVGECPFEDVPAGEWYTDAIAWAAENKIVEGYEGKFEPEAPMTREQMATLLYRYARYKGYDTSARGDVETFADSADISSWAKTAISWAKASGLVNGKENNLLDPQGSAVRVEAAAIIHRFCEKVAK